MTILFSPIGTADPITQLGDGPMLHIVRHRRPGTVVLFLSPAMAKHQDADGRYTRAIELLAQEDGFPTPRIELIRSDFDEVHRFDNYIAEFEGVLERLEKETGGEPVLVNVSSGTPAMEQALVALGSFGSINMKMLQVATPKKGVNGRQDREDPNNYDLAAMVEWCRELRAQEGDPERIVEVETPNFRDRLLRENVIELVGRFDYEAAYGLARKMHSIDPQARDMICAARDRLELNGNLPARVFGGTPLAYRADDLLVEYLYVMEVRLEQGHWADFVRAMTPALTETMKRCLRPYLPERSYLKIEKGRATDLLNLDAINQDSRLRYVLGDALKKRATFITDGMLNKLIKEYCKSDEEVVANVGKLRTVEADCRNPVAHTVRASSRNSIEALAGMSLESVMELFFELHGNAKPGMYRRVNDAILAKL